MRKRGRLLAAALMLFGLPALADVVPSLYGTTIASLSFEGDTLFDAKELALLTDLGPGRPLTPTGVHAALRNLYATHRFSDLVVSAAPAPEGTIVVIVFTSQPRVSKISFSGVDLPGRGRLLDAGGIEVGDPWFTTSSEAATGGIRRLLREQGYFESAVTSSVAAGEDDTSVEVTFEIRQGRRDRAASPAFNGALSPFTPQDLEKKAKMKTGKVYRESKAREDAERFATFLHDAGYARAEVRFEGATVDAATGLVTSHYGVFVGPKVVVVVEGSSGVTEKKIRKHAESPWTKGEPPDEDGVRRFAEVLKRDYQESGYARAKVETAFESAPGLDTIRFKIEKGDRYAVAHVGFEGVKSVPVKKVESVTRTDSRGLLSTGRLVEKDVAADKEAIASVLRMEGFTEARVSRVEVVDGKSPFTLDVTFHVEEGLRATVLQRSIDGTRALSPEEVAAGLSVVPGGPFRAADVDKDVAQIRAHYGDKGFVEATVDGVATLDKPTGGEGPKAHVTYSIFEGEPVWFGKTVIRGERRTRLSIARLQIAHEEGKPFSLAKLVETQQNLTRLGVFQRVEITSFATDPETRSRTVVVSLTEGKPWSFLYGIGAEYDSNADPRLNPRFSLGVTYNNLFGRALNVGVEARYSRRDSRLVATLRDRSLFDGKIPVALTIFRTRETRPTFEVSRRGTFIAAERRLSTKVKATLRYQYEIVEPTADPAILSTLERQNQQISISSVGTGLTYDTRDDPIDPKKGILIGSDFKYAFSFLDANARFLKGFVQGALYRPWTKTTLVFALQAGAIQSFGSCDLTANPTCPPNLEIPIAERFFAGGRSTHRAFALDDLGIEGQTAKNGAGFGGNGLLVGNVEWRIPVVGDLGIAIFLDAGNVWADYKSMELSQIRTGLGLGLRYLTPVGPLRLEYGRKLDKKANESAGAFSFSIGYPF
ncbi:MAG TPA: POTRA domain-containing protein [Thermoanaerobaculia bacterium]|nr:POTRA domain-containing protein [Thermoanaerobaculia bacterium]